MTLPSVELGTVASVERKSVKPDEIGSHQSYVGLENITADGTFVEVAPAGEANIKSNKFAFSSDHILYGKLRPYLSKIAAPQFGGVCSTDIVPIRPGPDIDRRFLLHVLRAPAMVGHATRLAVGANLPRLSPKSLETFPIPLPPIEEQQRIAAVLDAADELRAKRREALAKLDTLTRAIFIDMFGPTGLAGELKVLGDALGEAELFTDGDWVESKDQDPTGEVRLTQLADIGVGTWLDKSERYMNLATANRLRCTFLKPGDVLVARMPDPIGRACIFPGDRRPSVTAVDVCIIRPNPGSIDARWLVEALNLPRTQSEIERRATGSTRSRISRRNLAKVEVAVPPLDAQRKFAARAAEAERGRTAQLGSSERLNDLFSSLQQRAFRGEL